MTITLQALSLVEKGRVGPSLLHTMLEGPTEYVNARWMYSPHGFLHSIEWIMFNGHLDYFQKPPLTCRPNTKPRDHGKVKPLIKHVIHLEVKNVTKSSIELRL